MEKTSHELILCIVNAGFSEMVMDAAKEVGARGGTVIHARGTANKEAEEYFHITIQPDKEIVMILAPSEIKDDILHAVYRSAGLKSEGQGIAFSMPVSHVVGISKTPNPAIEQTVQKTDEPAQSETDSQSGQESNLADEERAD